MKNLLNQTLNEVFSFVATGANYASNLAKELNKSIPVIYRQLELLVNDNIIEKYRDGKRVLYKIRWNVLNGLIANQITSYCKDRKDDGVLKDKWRRMDLAKLKEACQGFFLLNETHLLVNKFLKLLQDKSKNYDFNKTIFLFCQSLGRVPAKAREIYKKSKDAGYFIEFCRLLNEEETHSDVRELFSKSL